MLITQSSPRRGPMLALACAAQFMVILDVAIVNVALPSIQRDLHAGRDTTEWVVIAYGLLLGGFLLLGGRLVDRHGARALLVAGLSLFAVGSLAAGLSSSVGWLIIARAVQGLGAALIPPAALAIIASTFVDADGRARALGLYGAVTGVSASVGVIASGLITDSVGWRWIFLINVPIGATLAATAARTVSRDRPAHPATGGLVGATIATGALLTLVYALDRGAGHGWTRDSTLALLAGGVTLLVLFAAIQARSANPLIPRAVLHDRNEVAANIVAFFAFGSVLGFIFLGSLLMQQQLGYSPIRTGAAWLATTAVSFLTAATTGAALVRLVGVRALLVTGHALMALAALWLVRIPADGHYLPDVLPALVAVGVGGGLAAPAAQIAALGAVKPEMAGIASGLLETMREIGGSAAVAVVSTVLLSQTHVVASGSGQGHRPASAHAFHLAYVVVVALATLGALISALTIRQPSPAQRPAAADPVAASERVG